MPVLPPASGLGSEPVYPILNAARVRVHEKMPTLAAYSGIILSETEPSTQQAFNSAYRLLQSTMANAGSSTFEASAVIYGIPPVNQGALDPATECWISKDGCSDGVGTFSTPALPANLMTPLWMSERWNGSMQPFPSPRKPNIRWAIDGLAKTVKTNWNGSAQWRGEVIYYPGSLQTEDFWIYYQQYFPDVDDVNQTPWFQQSVPITRCQSALSLWLCRELAMSMSGDPTLDPDVRQQAVMAVAEFETMALSATRLLVSPDKKRKQRTNYTRLPFANGGQGGSRGSIGSGGIPAFTGGGN